MPDNIKKNEEAGEFPPAPASKESRPWSLPHLSESSQFLEKVMDVATNAIFVIDTAGKVVMMNKAEEELTGYSSGELIGRSFDILLEPGLLPEVYKEFEKVAVRGETVRQYETTLTRKNGEKRNITFSLSPLFENEKIICVVGTAEDITEQKIAENKIRESADFLQTLIDAIPNPIFYKNAELIYTGCNKAFMEYLGKQEGEIIGKTVYDMGPKELADIYNEKDLELLRNGGVQVYHARVLNADGTRHDVVFNKAVFKNPYGSVAGLIGVLQDISDLKKAEENLKIIRERYDVATSVGKVGTWDWNPVSGELVWTEEVYRIFDYAPDEVTPSYELFLGLVHPDDREAVNGAVVRAIKEKTPYNIDCRITTKKGREVVCNAIGKVTYDEEGNAIRMLGTFQDITDRKLSEAEIIDAKEKAEEATALKDKFVTLVSHDLKAPLSTMIGVNEMILGNIDSLHKMSNANKLLIASIESGRKMYALIEDLLSLTRIKSGEIKPKMKFMNLYNMVLKAIKILEPLAEKKEVKLINEIPAHSRVYGDENLLYEVIQNLAINGIKFSQKGDSVTLFMPAGEKSTFVVKDTGVGIEKENLDLIFSSEKSLSTLGTAGETGTGLGLPICREIVEAHGGLIKVKSEIGKGSSFFVRLPYQKPLVLLVDDEPIFRLEQYGHLKKCDIDVLEAKNGDEAISIIKSTRPHLIISDVRMFTMGGIELTQWLKNNPETMDIPIIIATVLQGLEVREKAFLAGANDFVQKPLNPDDFIARVQRFIG